MNDKTRTLLTQMADALDGARTWIDNMEAGSHARKLPAVDVVEYMPNGITGRGVMHDLAEMARRAVALSPDIGPEVSSDAEHISNMVFHALKNELGMAAGDPSQDAMPAFAEVKLLAPMAGRRDTTLIRLRRDGQPDVFARVVVLDDTP